MVTLKEVYNAYFQCRKNKRKTINQVKFELYYEYNCIQLWKDINNRTYKIGKSICFIVTRPKLREIFAANFRDRIVHHIIMNKLESIFEKQFIYDAYNCRKNKGILFGVNRLAEAIKKCSDNYTRDCYIAKFDLKGFFMSIYKPLLWRKLKIFVCSNYNGIDKEDLLYLIRKVVFNHPQYNCTRKGPLSLWNVLDKDKSLFTVGENYGMPIGNLTSQVFANFYLDEIDHILSTIFLFYGRYVDDFFIIDKDKNKILKSIFFIKQLTSVHKVKLHPNKMYLQHYSKGCKFTGSVIKLNRVYIGNRTVSNCIKTIMKNNINISSSTAESFVASINSYFGYFKYCKTYAIKYNLINRISPDWQKFINVSLKLDKLICKCNKPDNIKDKIKTYDQNVWAKEFIFPNS